jgi:hypothetical protein
MTKTGQDGDQSLQYLFMVKALDILRINIKLSELEDALSLQKVCNSSRPPAEMVHRLHRPGTQGHFNETDL